MNSFNKPANQNVARTLHGLINQESVHYVGHPDQLPPVKPSRTRNAAQTREERTQALIENFRGNPTEFAMLKGVLCATHKMNYADQLVFEGLLNGLMIAERMDELIREVTKGAG